MKFNLTSPRPALLISRLRLPHTLAAMAMALATVAASAGDFTAGDIHIRAPLATPTPPGSKIGASYFVAENRGSQDDRLLRASSPASARIELHSGEIGGDGVMRMRELEALPLPAGKTVELRPGQGNHLMLMELRKPLAAGDTFPMTLEFERGGKVEVQVQVQAPKPGAAHGSGHQH
jgi:copper(I)-binding protein